MTPATTSFPKSKIGVSLFEGVHEIGVGMLRDEGFDVGTSKSAAVGDVEALAETRVLGIRSKTKVTREMLDAMPKLLAIGAFCIGTNQIDLDEASARGIPVFNSPFGNTRSVAELTIAEAVMLMRRTFASSADLHTGKWQKSAKGSHEVRGKTIGLIGYGHIGMQVSVLAEALGMRVVFYDISPKLALGNAKRVGSIETLLESSDVVSLHVPATPGTDCLIGPEQVRLMKPGAVLLNNARGSVVDVDALAMAIRDGRLGGAAVDVFPEEPSGNTDGFESPLLGLPNVILTPHVGGSTEEAQESIADDVATKLISFINTGCTSGAVNVPEVDLPEQPRVGERRSHRILNFHRNEPGYMRRLNGAIADRGLNVVSQFLQTREQIGYVVLDVDPTDAEAIRAELEGLDGSIRTRVLW